MHGLASAFPDRAALEEILREIFRTSAGTLVRREPNRFASTFPSEIVTYRIGKAERRLLCKYEGGRSHTAHGHRGNVAYEADVYREVLARLETTAPEVLGASSTGEWLVVEYLDGCLSAADTEPEDAPAALERAAAWVGSFHAATKPIAPELKARLKSYDADYYARWFRRTSLLAGPWHDRLPWLEDLCAGAERIGDELAAQPATVVHGEYVPHNVLLLGERVCPVDWESAAVAFGEIDIAALVDKWPEATAERCIRAYVSARYGDAEPADLSRRLDLGRLYWDARWLGDRPEWTTSEKVGPRFEHLRRAATNLGLLP
jgi:hypothetical protein